MKFEYAVEEYTTYLLKLSFLYVKDRQVAEDIVQDVFEKLYEKHGAELPFVNAKGYFVQSVVNKCRDYFRSWQYRKVQVVDLFHQHEQAYTPEFAEPELVNYVLSLPMKYREIIILYYFDEQGTTEIAGLLHIPVGTVKSRLQKARQLLKGILLEEGAEDDAQQIT